MGKVIIFGFLLAALYSCTSNSNKISVDKNKLLLEIKESENKLYEDTLMRINISAANNAVILYSRFANNFPDDSSSVEYLFRAGELCKALNKGQLALSYYEKIESEYPSFPKLPLVIFMQGFVNETQLKDYEKAKYHYQRYIDKYPKSKLSNDLKVVIENLGKSDEELIKSFKEKEKKETNCLTFK
jgi:outer membrane protein assembly factor BamD (BamD/ComL family)